MSTENSTGTGPQEARPRRPLKGLRAVYVTLICAAVLFSLFLLVAPDHEGLTKAAARNRPSRNEAEPVATGVSVAVPTVLQPKLPNAQVTLGANPGLNPVPRSFLGISTEYWALPDYEQHMGLFEHVLSLIHPQGNGPFVLRVGGDSADQSFWDPTAVRMPHWAVGLTPSWLKQTSTLVGQTGTKLIIDLNLVTGTPIKSAQWAKAAITHLPAGSIAGFEVGNEPDIYDRAYWREFTEADTARSSLVLPRYLTAANYSSDFRTYSRLLARFAPTVPLLGPAIANPYTDINWVRRLADGPHPGLGAISAHRYPYSACSLPNAPTYPTVPRLLSEHATAGMAASLAPAVRIAHRAGLPVRVTELNSVTCGGRRGVSDSFATGLWAPDALFELLKVGVSGVNVHVRATLINAAFRINRDGLIARPLLYGLIMFSRMLGPQARVVNLNLHANPAIQLKAWAVRLQGDRLNVLLIDKSKYSVNVALRLPASGAGTVQRLLAPSAYARSGVTLDGQHLGADGRWLGTASTETVAPASGGYVVSVPSMSAALVTVHLRPGAIRRRTGRVRSRARLSRVSRRSIPREASRHR